MIFLQELEDGEVLLRRRPRSNSAMSARVSRNPSFTSYVDLQEKGATAAGKIFSADDGYAPNFASEAMPGVFCARPADLIQFSTTSSSPSMTSLSSSSLSSGSTSSTSDTEDTATEPEHQEARGSGRNSRAKLSRIESSLAMAEAMLSDLAVDELAGIEGGGEAATELRARQQRLSKALEMLKQEKADVEKRPDAGRNSASPYELLKEDDGKGALIATTDSEESGKKINVLDLLCGRCSLY